MYSFFVPLPVDDQQRFSLINAIVRCEEARPGQVAIADGLIVTCLDYESASAMRASLEIGLPTNIQLNPKTQQMLDPFRLMNQTSCPHCQDDISFALPGPELSTNQDWVGSIIEKIQADANSWVDDMPHWPINIYERWLCPVCGTDLDIEFSVNSDLTITDLVLYE